MMKISGADYEKINMEGRISEPLITTVKACKEFEGKIYHVIAGLYLVSVDHLYYSLMFYLKLDLCDVISVQSSVHMGNVGI
ncbi:hypothetical protein OIU84_004537 [Salix udensis]|uniref:Uncharacterized protein n=1 Tax=Salix udensis TaxID=889485 RepID=A0AAD6K2F3_9ROSI|nr:hypothetical protein OIU84_004537 [Salix udensis]